jgi:hypothetical protein
MDIEFLGWRPDPNVRLERREAGVQPDRGYRLGRSPMGVDVRGRGRGIDRQGSGSCCLQTWTM